MTVVVDVGCATHGTEESIRKLVDRFHPTTLYGFDPLARDGVTNMNGTVVVQRAVACWVEDGFVPFAVNTTRSRVVASVDDATREVEAIDFSHWIADHASGNLVVKLDIEGAEYDLIADMIATAADEHIALLLVEWHPIDATWERQRDRLIERLSCLVEEWQ